MSTGRDIIYITLDADFTTPPQQSFILGLILCMYLGVYLFFSCGSIISYYMVRLYLINPL